MTQKQPVNSYPYSISKLLFGYLYIGFLVLLAACTPPPPSNTAGDNSTVDDSNTTNNPEPVAVVDTLRTAPEIGALAPNFTLPGLDGQQVQLSDFRGRPTVLIFMHTW